MRVCFTLKLGASILVHDSSGEECHPVRFRSGTGLYDTKEVCMSGNGNHRE